MDACDLVVLYVNNQDQVWRKTFVDFCEAHEEYTEKLGMINGERFRDDLDLFKLNLQFIRLCLPFIRKRYLVISNIEQIDGLDTDGYEIVLHKDIMPSEILPTFNSSVIEMFIHNIKGLAERVIYLNDDMIPLRVMSESDFFTKDGDAKMNIYTLHETTNNSLFRQLCVNEYRMIMDGRDAYLGDDYYIRPEHSVSVLFKSVMQDVFERFNDYIMSNTEPFRTERQFNQYAYIYEMVARDMVVPSELRYLYVKLRSKNFLDNCYAICDTSGSKIDWICANDDEKDELLPDKELRGRIFRKALTLCLDNLKGGK